MKKIPPMRLFAFLTILLFGTTCNGQVKQDLPKEKEHPNLIKKPGNGNVQCSIQDQAGNLWFGTSDDGLYKYDGTSFSQFLVADGLKSNCINDILEDKEGNIWIGTKEGICLYDGKTFANIQIPVPKDLPPNKNKFAQMQVVHDIMQDKAGKLWFATIDGVYVYDGTSFTLFVIDGATNGFMGSNDKAERIFEDHAGNIWFGGRTNEGVFRYDGKSVTHFPLPAITLQFETRQVSHSWAWPQVQDSNGNIWFSNWGGAYRYDGKTFTSFTKSDGLAGHNGLVAKIIADQNGNILLGGDGGLSRYDGKSFTSFKNGLINPWIWTILEDKTGKIWVGTRETGLYRFDGKVFANYSENKQ
jgi:ligand-binding sensor domain-containing protein